MRCLRGWSVVGDDILMPANQLSLVVFMLQSESTHEHYRHRADDRYGR